MNERLTEIEIKVARHDDLLEELNKIVYQQQRKIDELETLCSAMARRLKEAQEAGVGIPDEKPPHY